MVVDTLYEVNRGNQNQSVGLIINGTSASVQIYGSQRKPTQASDMQDLTDSEVMNEGAYTFATLPQFIYFTGTAESIDIISANTKESETQF